MNGECSLKEKKEMFRTNSQDNKKEGVHEMLRSELSHELAERYFDSLTSILTDAHLKHENEELERRNVMSHLEEHRVTWNWNESPGFTMDSHKADSYADSAGPDNVNPPPLHPFEAWNLTSVISYFLDGVVRQGMRTGETFDLEGSLRTPVREVEQLQDRAICPLRLSWSCDGSRLLSLKELPVSTDWRVSHPLSISGGGHAIFS
jgi:hypothetical protein